MISTHRGLGGPDGPQACDRHGRRHGHALERREAVLHRGARQVGKAFRILGRRFIEILQPAAAEMTVSADVIAHRSAPELVTGQPRDLSRNVPQGQVDPRDGGGSHDAVAMPKMLAIHHLPEMLDARRILADEQLRQILDRANHAPGMPFQRGLAPTEQTGLIGDNFDKHPVSHPGVTHVGFNRGDLHELVSDGAE